MPYVFPAHVFNPQLVRTTIERVTVSGGVSLAGVEDTVLTDGGGRWKVELGGINLRTPDQLRTWEVWNGHLAAGTVECLVPMLSLTTAPRPSQGRLLARPSNIYADDPVFPTEVRFASPYIVAATAASAALRAPSLEITVTRGAPIKGGEKFSIGERAHRITQKLGGGVFKIEPPLRDAVAAGTSVNFDWPLLRCKAVPGEDWSPQVEFGRRAEAQITFVESI